MAEDRHTVAMDWLRSTSRLLPAAGYRRERWRNGLGWTHEILRLPAQGDWAVRLSVAEVEQAAAFSAFPGIEREIVLLQGEGMRLDFDDGEQAVLVPPFGRLRFAGERPLTGVPLGGATRDFNAMWRRETVDATLVHRPLVGSMLFVADAGVAWSLYLLSGQACFPDAPALAGMLEAGDSAWLGAGERTRHRLEGNGELLAVRWTPVGAVPEAVDGVAG